MKSHEEFEKRMEEVEKEIPLNYDIDKMSNVINEYRSILNRTFGNFDDINYDEIVNEYKSARIKFNEMIAEIRNG